MQSIMVGYIPGLHQGYIQFFEKWCRQAPVTLYILDEDVQEAFPLLKKEIRAIKPAQMCQILMHSGYFQHVEVIDAKGLRLLSQKTELQIVMSDEAISDYVRETYFPHHKVVQDKVFLRFDEKYVQQVYGEEPFDGTVTEDEFYREILAKAEVEAQKSSDWFRQVGGAIVFNDPLQAIRYGHNQRMPAPHACWLEGDPRLYLPYGSDPNLSATAHMEVVLTAQAAADGISTKGASLITTIAPCPACKIVIALAGYKRVYFKTGYAQIKSEDIFTQYKVEMIKII